MYVCISITVNLEHLNCAITTDTQQHEEQLEAILSLEVVVYLMNIPNFIVRFAQFSLHLSVGFIAPLTC